MTDGKMPEMIRVYLDAVFPSGHHAFADSENNGPWATALVKEFIPFLEGKFRMDAVPQGRLLTGHSSGGWSTLWLQINYPDFFGGVWASSPDPVDFRSFLNVDLTKNPPENFYRAADKMPRNVLRYQMFNLMNLEDYAQREQAFAAQGGQLASFEAVFSPRGKDGLPLTLFNRATGAIDPDVQKAWERFDISRFLRTNWKRLEPQLKGKIHIFVGASDNFHLEKPVSLLRDSMKEMGSDASFTFIEGGDHTNLYKGDLAARIAREIYQTARTTKTQ